MTNTAPNPLESLAENEDHESVEIFCPDCHYNLRGLSGNRCPECGSPYNLNELIEQVRGGSQPLPFGRRGGTKTSFIAIFQASLFEPSRLGRDLPAHPNQANVRAYGLIIRLASAVVGASVWIALVLLQLTVMKGLVLIMLPAFCLIAIPASYMCELAVAGVLRACVVPCNVPTGDRFRFWWTLCNCFSTYFLLTIWLAMLTWMGTGIWEPSLPFHLIISAIVLIMTAWWWLALGKAVIKRGLPSRGRTIAVLLVPVIGLATILLMVLCITVVPLLLSRL